MASSKDYPAKNMRKAGKSQSEEPLCTEFNTSTPKSKGKGTPGKLKIPISSPKTSLKKAEQEKLAKEMKKFLKYGNEDKYSSQDLVPLGNEVSEPYQSATEGERSVTV